MRVYCLLLSLLTVACFPWTEATNTTTVPTTTTTESPTNATDTTNTTTVPTTTTTESPTNATNTTTVPTATTTESPTNATDALNTTTPVTTTESPTNVTVTTVVPANVTAETESPTNTTDATNTTATSTTVIVTTESPTNATDVTNMTVAPTTESPTNATMVPIDGSATTEPPTNTTELANIQFSPEVNGSQYSVDLGRRFSLSCILTGPYAGTVYWLHEGELVESVSESESRMESGQNTGSGELEATSGSADIDTTLEHLPPLGDPTVLYMKTNSNSPLANLTTHPNFGALVEVEGEYTCVAANQHGNFTQTISVEVTEPRGLASYAILRFSVNTPILQDAPRQLDEGYFLVHLETLFLDQIPDNPDTQEVVQCRPARSRPVDIENGWSRVQCNISVFLGTSSPTDPTAMIEEALQNGLLSDLVIISTIRSSPIGFCDFDLTTTDHGDYTWNETEGGSAVTLPCALGPADGVDPREAVALRNCTSIGEWEEPELSRCITIVSSRFLELQETLMQEGVTGENYEDIAEQLAETVREAAESEEDQTAENLDVVVEIFNSTVALLSNPDSEILIEESTVTDFVEVLDNLQEWNEDVVQEDGAGSNLVQNFETIVTNLVDQDNFSNLTIIRENVAFIAERIQLEELQDNGRSFSLARTDGTLGAVTGESNDSQLAPQEIASISLPPSLFDQIGNPEEEAGLFFSLYEDPVLFPLARGPGGSELSNTTVVGSPVVAASVGRSGGNVRNLPNPVVIHLRLIETEEGNRTNPRCVSWDFGLAGGDGNWTTEGCETVTLENSPDLEVVECQCNHLTNFACLVDICSRAEGCNPPSPPAALTLDTISIVGVALSLVWITFTIITLLVFKKLRQRDTTVFHIQLCIALFCLLLVFVVGIDRTEVYEGCVTVSVFIHYFTLVAVMWMGAEAALLFLKLLTVFLVTIKHIVAISLTCWLVPIVPVVIPVAVDSDLMVTFLEGTSETEIKYCFTGKLAVFFGAFLGPIVAVLIFVVIVAVLVQHSMHTLGKVKEEMNRKTTICLLLVITGVTFLFALTWVFGAFAISSTSLTFQILFAVFNTLQGFFIFLVFCVLNKDARGAWKKVLACDFSKTSFTVSLTTGHTTSKAKAETSSSQITMYDLGYSPLGQPKSKPDTFEFPPTNSDNPCVLGTNPDGTSTFKKFRLAEPSKPTTQQAETSFDTSEVIANPTIEFADEEETTTTFTPMSSKQKWTS